MTDQELIKTEIESILKDIIKAYESSGKKVSGQFREGLEAVYEPDKATIKGFVYLAGRKGGKMPPVKALKEWVKRKGIFEVKTEAQVSSLAYVIARKIAEEGTSKNYVMKIYEQVITPQRINSIIEKVSQLNVNRLVTELQAEFRILEKNV